MAEPTEKAPAIRAMLDELSTFVNGRSASESIKSDICVRCGKPVDDTQFRDECSKREYRITGLCQQCQNEIYDAMADQS